MSYKEVPQLKLFSFVNGGFQLNAIIDDFQECSFEDNLYEAGQFSITINFNIPNSQLFQKGLFVQFGNSWKFGEISKIQDKIGENGKGSQYRIITGFDARYILKRRVIKNMNSNGLWVMTGKGEIVLRNLINDQAGTNAEEKRRLPITNTIPDSENAIGEEYSASEQFSNLYEVCKTIATQSEMGWRLEFNGTALTLVCFEGTDRTQTVQFSTSFDSLANGEFIDSSESFANAIYVGGKGQNEDRDIYEGESAIEGNSPSGLDRFESWDNQSSMTTESEYETEALSMLNQYGQTLTMSGNGLAKCPYEYEKEYFVGDKIKIAFSGKSANAQILSVTEHWAFGAYEINFSFGKPLPDLNTQLQLMLKQIQKASNKTSSTDSVKWYTIPTDTSMPASDVTFDTIGFEGNCASGGSTFTLYLDDEKTGAKTYHVYFKQLGGGNLTLTTGKEGATDLVLNSGTYVAIIYVDDEGNITNTASTPSTSIVSGNTQPAESGAVADELSSIETEISGKQDTLTAGVNIQITDDEIEGVNDLPTDAVLHYSFDELPDYPDGSADERNLNGNTYNVSFLGNGTVTTDPYVAGDNKIHKSNVNGNANYKSDLSVSTARGVYNGLKRFAGKILIFEMFVKTSNLQFRIEYKQTSSSAQSYLPPLGNTISIGKHRVVLFIPNDVYQYTLTMYATNIGDGYLEWELLNWYIGDGSYSTPIIDNTNGQHNATNNGGLAVEGVSGKGVYLLEKKYVSLPSDFNLTPNFSVSLWANIQPPSGVSGNIHFLRNPNILSIVVQSGGNIAIYLYDENSTALLNNVVIGNISRNKLHHIVFTREGTSFKMFVDGVQVYVQTLANGTIKTNSGTFALNSNLGVYPYFCDDFQIFDRALTEKEVKALYNNKAQTPKYYSLADYSKQGKTLETPLTIGGTQYTTVEGALGAIVAQL